MYNICATDMAFEQCAKDKREINMVMPYAVFHFVLSGEGYINGQKITKNTVFISSKENHMHYYPSRIDPWSYIYIRLNGVDTEKAFENLGFNKGITIRSFDDSETLYDLLTLFNKLWARENQKAQTVIANAFLMLFENPKPQRSKSKSIERMEQIKRYIEENYYKKLSMEEIAARFYINKNYMCTLFIKNIGISPKQYLQNIRLKRAEHLLLTSNESVKVIASSVGYDDPLLFSKIFKERYKKSPVQFRKDNG